MIAYAATTRDITVTVKPIYLDEKSDFFEKKFAFAYYIQIENAGPREVQLLRRNWTITEQTGKVQRVEGEGVVGQQPVILPQGSHVYSSYCIIHGFAGTMEGSYLMQGPDGERFKVTIPRFHLQVAAN